MFKEKYELYNYCVWKLKKINKKKDVFISVKSVQVKFVKLCLEINYYNLYVIDRFQKKI